MKNNPLAAHHTFEPLLGLAQQIAQQEKQPVDTLHILLAALSPATKEALVFYRSLDERARGILIEHIKVELRFSQQTPSTGQTKKFIQCREIWEQRTKEQRLLMPSDALILLTILNEDARATQFLSMRGADVNSIITALEASLKADLELESRHVPGESSPIESGEEFRRFYRVLSYQQAKVKIDRNMHDVQMNNFLNLLGAVASHKNGHFVVVCGQRGSPLEDMANVLAYRLENEHFIGERSSLNQYKQVYDLNIDMLKLLATQPGQDASSPARALRKIKHQAVAEHAIIILTNFQKMATRKRIDPVGEAIKFELADPGDAVIAGFFEYDQEQPSDKELTLDLANARIVAIEPDAYTKENTLRFLKEYYAERWKEAGYCFEDNAFDSVIALEQGAWIDKRRKTLPHLASGLGSDTIQTASSGKKSIEDTANCALACLHELLTFEQPLAKEEDLARFDETLKQAEQDIKWLLSNPEPKEKDGFKQLTRAHVIAQLICHNDSEFHYTGFTPRKHTEPRIKSVKRS